MEIGKSHRMGQNTTYKKLRYWLWESNVSWIFMLILAFVVVKLIIFPISGLALGSDMPFVVVESGSMHHCCGFDEYWLGYGLWYRQHNITEQDFKRWHFVNGLNKGDIVITKGQKDYNIGDIIIYWPTTEKNHTPIIHRVIAKQCENANATCIYETKGDNNQGQLPFENSITQSQVIAKALWRLPKLGWVKLILMRK